MDNKSINLLYFGSDYKVGLTTALSEQILEIQKSSKVNLYCISSENEMEEGLLDKLKSNHVNLSIIPHLDEHTNFKYLCEKLETIILSNSITHINVHNNWQMALISYIKYKHIIPRKFKIIYTIHGYRHNSQFKSLFAIPMIGLSLLLFADRVISMSSYVSRKFWFVGYKTDIVFYIMSKPEFNKKSNKVGTDTLKMVFPAQFRAGKNQNILIRALAIYINNTHDNSIKLYLPGDGPLLDECKVLAQSLGVSTNVIFPGKLSHKEVIDLYENTNIALVASNVETYGRCIAEPYALGRCLITKKTGVAIDIIRNGENGLFFSDSKQLADILINLHNNPNRISEIADAAFNNKSIFSSEHVMNSYFSAIMKA